MSPKKDMRETDGNEKASIKGSLSFNRFCVSKCTENLLGKQKNSGPQVDCKTYVLSQARTHWGNAAHVFLKPQTYISPQPHYFVLHLKENFTSGIATTDQDNIVTKRSTTK